MPRPDALRPPLVVLAVTMLAVCLALAAARIGTARGASETPRTLALPAGFQPEGNALLVAAIGGEAEDAAYVVVSLREGGPSRGRGMARR